MTAALCFTQVQTRINPNDVVEVVAGLMDGVIRKDDLQELKSCLTGTEQLAASIETTVASFKKGDIVALTSAIMSMQSVFEKLPSSFERCVRISADIAKFEQWSAIFRNPKELAQRVSYNMLFKSGHISADIKEALKQWDKKNFFGFGEQIGEALQEAVAASFLDF